MCLSEYLLDAEPCGGRYYTFMTKKLSIVGFVAVVAVVGYWAYLQRAKKTKSVVRDPIYALNPSFHPDSVHEFVWSIGGKRFEFQREVATLKWRPEVYSQIQTRLNVLAQFHAEAIELRNPVQVEVELHFSDKSVWRGAWDGQAFQWLEGAQRGRGVKLVSGEQRKAENMLFQSGKYAFVPGVWNFCPARPTRLILTQEGRNSELKQEGVSWLLNGKAVSATAVEKWLGENCQQRTEQVLQPELLTRQLAFNDGLSVEFVGHDPVTLKMDGEGLFHNGEFIAVLPKFKAALLALFTLSLEEVKQAGK